MTEPKPPGEKTFEMALSALADFACNEELAGYRPGKIEVKDSALAEHLGGLLAEAGIKVEQRKKLFTFDQKAIFCQQLGCGDYRTVCSSIASFSVYMSRLCFLALGTSHSTQQT